MNPDILKDTVRICPKKNAQNRWSIIVLIPSFEFRHPVIMAIGVGTRASVNHEKPAFHCYNKSTDLALAHVMVLRCFKSNPLVGFLHPSKRKTCNGIGKQQTFA
jgi:hypothetical protein